MLVFVAAVMVIVKKEIYTCSHEVQYFSMKASNDIYGRLQAAVQKGIISVFSPLMRFL